MKLTRRVRSEKHGEAGALALGLRPAPRPRTTSATPEATNR